MMKGQETRHALRQIVAIPVLLALLMVSVLALDWRSALLAGVAITYLAARQLDRIMNLGLARAYGRLRTRWKIALTLLVFALLQIPLVLLSDWDKIRVPALAGGIAVIVMLLAWSLWMYTRQSNPKRSGS
jgi:hypothetical protein